jgi:hypothetical protein
MVMKKEIVEYIEKLITRGKPLTDSQARTIAYWELVAFTEGINYDVGNDSFERVLLYV